MERKELKNIAKGLYVTDELTQRRIAELLGVSEQTISKWAKKENWLETKVKHHHSEEARSQYILELIDYQLRALKQFAQEKEDKGALVSLDKGEVDALTKLYANVKQKEITFDAYCRIINEFITYLETKDITLVKALFRYTDDFLMSKRK